MDIIAYTKSLKEEDTYTSEMIKQIYTIHLWGGQPRKKLSFPPLLLLLLLLRYDAWWYEDRLWHTIDYASQHTSYSMYIYRLADGLMWDW